MFEVVKKWSNRDSERELVVAEFQTEQEAQEDAARRKTEQVFPWSGFIVRAVTPNGEVKAAPLRGVEP